VLTEHSTVVGGVGTDVCVNLVGGSAPGRRVVGVAAQLGELRTAIGEQRERIATPARLELPVGADP
jgi:hypothetical protein